MHIKFPLPVIKCPVLYHSLLTSIFQDVFTVTFQIYLCKPCHRIFKSTSAFSPPLLSPRPHLAVAPEGEWLSRRCETRPNTLFLMRRLSFFRDRTWQGIYMYYKDETCSKSIFTIEAKGKYIQSKYNHHHIIKKCLLKRFLHL